MKNKILKNKKSILILLAVFSLSVILGLTVLYFVQKYRVNSIYSDRYTLNKYDNVPFDKNVPGNKITGNDFYLVSGINPSFNEWLIITQIKQTSDISGLQEEYKYITYVKLGIFPASTNTVKVDLQPGNAENAEILKKFNNNELLFILGDYNFVSERSKDITEQKDYLLKTYTPPRFEFGNDTYDTGNETFITSSQSIKLYHTLNGNSQDIDLINYLPSGYSKYHLLNIEKDKMLICAESNTKKECFVYQLPGIRLIKSIDMTTNWGFVFLSPDSEGIFVIETQPTDISEYDFTGKVLYLSISGESKEFDIPKERPKVYINENKLNFISLENRQTILSINLDQIN